MPTGNRDQGEEDDNEKAMLLARALVWPVTGAFQRNDLSESIPENDLKPYLPSADIAAVTLTGGAITNADGHHSEFPESKAPCG